MNDPGWPWTADTHCIAEKTRLSEPTTKIWMKIDLYCQQQKCNPMTLVSGGIRFLRIFVEVPWGEGVKRQWGCRQRQFSALSLAMSSETLEMRPALLHSDMQSVVSFSAIPKCMTLNDLQWLFRVKFGFRAGLVGSTTVRLSKNNCVKTNKYWHTPSAAQIFGGDSSFCRYKVCADIRSGSLERRH